MATLRAVLFDVDDTLFSTTQFAKKARHNAVLAMIEAGLRMPAEEVHAELEEVIREFSSNYSHHFDKLLMRLPLSAQVGTNPAVIVTAGVVAYHDTKFKDLAPFDDVKPFLRALAQADLLTGCITHGWTTKQAEKLIRLGLVPLLDSTAIFISDQVGISKPNPKLYSTALRKLGLEAEEVMYVGDNLAHDIQPPRTLGIHTAWIHRSAKAGQDLAIHPDHSVADFRELAGILRESYGVPLELF